MMVSGMSSSCFSCRQRPVTSKVIEYLPVKDRRHKIAGQQRAEVNLSQGCMLDQGKRGMQANKHEGMAVLFLVTDL